MAGYSGNHRACWHDYRERCIYFITIMKSRGVPNFSSLTGDYRIQRGNIGSVEIKTSEIGNAVKNAIWNIPNIEPAIKVMQYVIMPDHIHLLVNVQHRTEETLGQFIARFKMLVNRQTGINGVFQEGFNDQILKVGRNLNVIYEYIRDNARRLAVRRALPEWFRRVNRVVIGGRVLQAYGNVQLLDNPFKYRVVVHRADGPEARERCRAEWLYSAANGGVLVSPFISSAERAVRKEAEELGGNVILIQNEAFGERYKPSAGDFERCEEGKLLIIAPLRSVELTREVCLAMNRLAGVIAGE